MIADRHPFVVRQQRVVGAEHACRRSWRGGCRRRSRCSRRSRTAAHLDSRQRQRARGGERARALRCAARRSARDSARRSVAQRGAAQRGERVQGRAAARRPPRGAPRRRRPSASRSRRPQRPIADRDCDAAPAPAATTPKGRFWIGNSQPGRCADSTKLRARGRGSRRAPCRSPSSGLGEVRLQAVPDALRSRPAAASHSSAKRVGRNT